MLKLIRYKYEEIELKYSLSRGTYYKMTLPMLFELAMERTLLQITKSKETLYDLFITLLIIYLRVNHNKTRGSCLIFKCLKRCSLQKCVVQVVVQVNKKKEIGVIFVTISSRCFIIFLLFFCLSLRFKQMVCLQWIALLHNEYDKEYWHIQFQKNSY